ncbi:hypothetical protein PP175_25715 (plasmid) [Aneurinibacillus sp. Ricciae_BoGa-3]|uniref:hypothetical protein n=1 Tax=Aneurinibacillus sp. Ricciae_BoGa-3 TaxID=3022697 RepID=UPI00234058D1|nr:hypothetical protein [Aneurinibacillus sp. Ricciae_BoGa-3]WCK57467.1 hypothetical protein PP175_25715 [Aneurinibacillus sp. Ricciae_BoGa-3]
MFINKPLILVSLLICMGLLASCSTQSPQLSFVQPLIFHASIPEPTKFPANVPVDYYVANGYESLVGKNRVFNFQGGIDGINHQNSPLFKISFSVVKQYYFQSAGELSG